MDSHSAWAWYGCVTWRNYFISLNFSFLICQSWDHTYVEGVL